MQKSKAPTPRHHLVALKQKLNRMANVQMSVGGFVSTTRSRACRPAPETDPCAVTDRPGTPTCVHTGTEPEHGSCPSTQQNAPIIKHEIMSGRNLS